MREIKIIKRNGITFWAKKGENTYSRDIKELLDFLGIDYNSEEDLK